MKVTNRELVSYMIENRIVLEDVVSAVVEEFGIVGVGLISLREDLSKAVMSHIVKEKVQ